MDNAYNQLWWVVVEDGRMFMHLPDGTRIMGEIFCEVTDHANETPKAMFKMSVNIAGSIQEMNQKIDELNARLKH